jgi:hypothetical protein
MSTARDELNRLNLCFGQLSNDFKSHSDSQIKLGDRVDEMTRTFGDIRAAQGKNEERQNAMADVLEAIKDGLKGVNEGLVGKPDGKKPGLIARVARLEEWHRIKNMVLWALIGTAISTGGAWAVGLALKVFEK